MSRHTFNGQTHADCEANELCLFDILHNSLVLRTIAPYLPISGLLRLASTNKAIRSLIYSTPGAFRHLDVTTLKKAQFNIDPIDTGGEIWRNVQLDENLTEDDFYSGPLRGVFSALKRQDILRDVQTLVLDGLSVTSDLCYEIINDPSFSVRILSLRDVKNLNQAKLRGALQYACRKTRPEDSPRLKALYIFTPKDATQPSRSSPSSTARPTPTASSISSGWNHRSQQALTSSLQQETDSWWSKRGRTITRAISQEWVNCMAACEGIIAFDAVLCHGPRHRNSPAFGQPLMMADNECAVATYALGGCEDCGKAPEGLISQESRAATSLPLLTPPPLLSSSVRAATVPQQSYQTFVPRCADCLMERYCAGCNKWWCESCYQLPGQGSSTELDPFIVVDGDDSTIPDLLELHSNSPKIKSRISKSCWECGNNCEACISKTQRVCQKCSAGYCITHNEGSSPTFCDWCVTRGRGLGRQDKSCSRSMIVTGGIPVTLARRRFRDALTRPLL